MGLVGSKLPLQTFFNNPILSKTNRLLTLTLITLRSILTLSLPSMPRFHRDLFLEVLPIDMGYIEKITLPYPIVAICPAHFSFLYLITFTTLCER